MRKLLTLSRTASLLSKHRLPVVSYLTQPQIASSPLKSGLYLGRFTAVDRIKQFAMPCPTNSRVRWTVLRPSPSGGCFFVPVTGQRLRKRVSVPGPAAAQQTPSNSQATGKPEITGTAQVDQLLTATTSGIQDADGPANVAFEYQRLADNAEISGATGSTYTPATGDAGQTIKVTVTFTDDGGPR